MLSALNEKSKYITGGDYTADLKTRALSPYWYTWYMDIANRYIFCYDKLLHQERFT